MRALPVALALSLLVVLLAGCSKAPNAPAEIVVQSTLPEEVHSDSTPTVDLAPKDRGHLAGIVVDEAVHPIAGAIVRLPGLDLTRTSDRDGAFSFVDLRPGPYYITVNATGFYMAEAVLEVKVDDFTRAKVVLKAIPPPEPYHVTQKFEGFAELTSDPILGFSWACSSCSFDWYLARPGLNTMIVEAVTDAPTQGDGFYHQLYPYDGGYNEELSYGESSTPMRVELKANDLGAPDNDHFRLSINPESFPVYETSKKFTVFVTGFYNQDPPTGWALANGDS